MEKILEILSELNMISVSVRMLLAMLLGGVLGLEREQYKRAAGFRTFIIVCVGSALATMTGIYMKEIALSTEVARIPAQIISGMGFLGAGTILVTRNSKVKGLTTAASLWTSACIGIAVGAGFYAGAILGTLAIMLVLGILRLLESSMRHKSRECEIYLEATSNSVMRQIVRMSKANDIKTFDFEVSSIDDGKERVLSIIFRAKRNKSDMTWEEYVEALENLSDVIFVEEI